MTIKVDGHSHLIRDEESHAIVNTDNEAYRLTLRRRSIVTAQRNEINTLKNEVSEVKELLNKLIEKL